MSAGSVIVNVIADDTRYSEGMRRATRATSAATASWKKDFQSANKGFADLTLLASRAGGALAAAFSVSILAQAADKVALLSARVKQSTSSLGEYNTAFKALSESAIQIGTDLTNGVEIFQRLSFNRKELSATTDEMLLFTETVQKLGAASGASRDALSAGLLQLGQSLSSNIVRAEEFNSILENIPAVGNAIAKQLGVSTGELRNIVIQGKLLSKDVFAAILQQSDEANAAFANLPITLNRGFSTLMTGVGLFAAEINKASSATESLGSAMQNVGTYLSENTDKARQFGNVISDIAEGFVTIGGYLVNKGNADQLGGFLSQRRAVANGSQNTQDQAAIEARRREYDDVTRRMNQAMSTAAPRAVLQDYSGMGGAAGKANKEAVARQKELNSLYEKNRDLITGLDQATLKYIDTQKDLEALKRAGLITDQQLAEGVRRLQDEYDASTSKAQKWGIDLDQLGKRAAENIQDSFADFLFDPLDEGFSGMVAGFGNAIKRMLAEAAAANLVRVLLGSSSADGKSNKDGLLSGALDGIGSFVKKNFGGLFADGGTLGPGEWGIAGENGPEPIFGGKTGMTVIPNGGGAKGNTYNIDARGADQGAVSRIEQTLMALAGPGVIERRVGQAQQRGAL